MNCNTTHYRANSSSVPGDPTLFHRLSVFAGGWTLDAAEAVCGDAHPPGGRPRTAVEAVAVHRLPAGLLLDLLTHLVDQSLVVAEPPAAPPAGPGGEVRYRLLETIREYGGDRLVAAGEAATLHGRHRDYYLALAERAAAPRGAREQAVWLDRLEAEHANLRAALEWCRTEADGADAERRLAAALGRVWFARGDGGADPRRLAGSLARPGAHSPAARALTLSYPALVGDLLARELGQAARRRAAGAALSRDVVALFAVNTGWTAFSRGNHAAAQRSFQDSLPAARESGKPTVLVHALLLGGWLAIARGEDPAASAHLDEALSQAQILDHKTLIALAYIGKGDLARAQGDPARAQERYGQALRAAPEAPQETPQAGFERAPVVWCLVASAGASAAQGHAARAARLFGALDAWRLRRSLPWAALSATGLPAAHDRDLASARAALRAEGFAAAWAAGHAMTLEQAVAYALEAAPPPPAGPETTRAG